MSGITAVVQCFHHFRYRYLSPEHRKKDAKLDAYKPSSDNDHFFTGTVRIQKDFLSPQDVLARRPEAIEALFQALLLTGAAMTMAETSSPSSGGEHLLSHCLDMMSAVDGVPHDLHGRQVGVGTILAAELYRRVLEVESPDFREPVTTVDLAFWGRFGKRVEERYAEKVERLKTARDQLARGHRWDELRAELQPMLRPPQLIQSCLKNGGAAWKAEHIGCDQERLLAAFRHAHEIRPRFTILDLARLAGVLPDAAEDIVHEWA